MEKLDGRLHLNFLLRTICFICYNTDIISFSQIVFRPEPSKYKKLRSECADFLTLVSSSMVLLKNLKVCPDIAEIIDMASNWQV